MDEFQENQIIPDEYPPTAIPGKQLFSGWEHARRHFQRHASASGFSVVFSGCVYSTDSPCSVVESSAGRKRRRINIEDRESFLQSASLVCSWKPPKNLESISDSATSRRCPWCVRLKKCENGVEIVTATTHHNGHPLEGVPSDVHTLHQQMEDGIAGSNSESDSDTETINTMKNLTEDERKELTLLTSLGVSVPEVRKILRGKFPERLWPIKGIHNWKSKHFPSSPANDASTFLQLLQNQKGEDPGSFFSFRVDEAMRLNTVFWATSHSREMYSKYGSVVIFDATYKTNRFGLPFVNFVGVDANWGCINFGVGLVSAEDDASYIWLLETFLSCHQQPPETVITDEDHSMANAVRSVLPHSDHYLCLWHLLTNAGKRFDRKTMAYFQRVVWAETEEQFDEAVARLHGNCVLTESQTKYLMRKLTSKRKWAAYCRNKFNLGINSTQRGESANAAIKTVLTSSSTSLKEVLEKWLYWNHEANLKLHFKEERERRVLSTKHRADELMSFLSSNFSPYAVSEMMSALGDAGWLRVDEIIEEPPAWLVADIPQSSREHASGRRVCKDPATGWHCSCPFFVRMGLLCKHIMAVKMHLKEQTHLEDRISISVHWLKKENSKSQIDSKGEGDVFGRPQRGYYWTSRMNASPETTSVPALEYSVLMAKFRSSIRATSCYVERSLLSVETLEQLVGLTESLRRMVFERAGHTGMSGMNANQAQHQNEAGAASSNRSDSDGPKDSAESLVKNPLSRRRPGNPGKKRAQPGDDQKLIRNNENKRKQSSLYCSKCRGRGHTAASCTKF